MAMLAQASRLGLRRLVSCGPQMYLKIALSSFSTFIADRRGCNGSRQPCSYVGRSWWPRARLSRGLCERGGEARLLLQCCGQLRSLDQAASCRLFSAAPAAPKEQDSGVACLSQPLLGFDSSMTRYVHRKPFFPGIASVPFSRLFRCHLLL
jgi:hypothetical protein